MNDTTKILIAVGVGVGGYFLYKKLTAHKAPAPAEAPQAPAPSPALGQGVTLTTPYGNLNVPIPAPSTSSVPAQSVPAMQSSSYVDVAYTSQGRLTTTQAQKFLRAIGLVGADGKPIVVDGKNGPNTAYAVAQYQKQSGGILPVTGVVDRFTAESILGNALAMSAMTGQSPF